MSTEMPISEARNKLSTLPEDLEREPGTVTVTRRGKPVLAILPWEAYEAITETLEILGDEEAMAGLRQGIEDIKAGRVTDLEEVKKELGL